MFDGTIDAQSPDKQQELLESLRELEQNVPEAIRRKRGRSRVTFRSRVLLRSANLAERDDDVREGVTGDISATGCQLLCDRPLLVGNVYEIEFDRSDLDSPPVVARCLRVRMLDGDNFEIGFAFFCPIDVSDLLNDDLDDTLV